MPYFKQLYLAYQVLCDELKRRDSVMCKALEDLMQDVVEQREREAADKAREELAKEAAAIMYENDTKIDLIATAFKVPVETVEQWLGLVHA